MLCSQMISDVNTTTNTDDILRDASQKNIPDKSKPFIKICGDTSEIFSLGYGPLCQSCCPFPSHLKPLCLFTLLILCQIHRKVTVKYFDETFSPKIHFRDTSLGSLQ